MKSNREAKKPKADKNKTAATVSASPFPEPPAKAKPSRDK